METTPSASEQKLKPEPQKETPPLKSGVIGALGEMSQYALFAGFGLYVLGFLIWRSYLSDYGIASLGFFQMEYISAAICYLILVSAFSIAPGVILARLLSNAKWESNYRSFDSLLATWSVLFLYVIVVFFPSFNTPTLAAWAGGLVLGIIAITMILRIYYSAKTTQSKFSKVFTNNSTYTLIGCSGLVVAYFCLFVWGNRNLSESFVLSSIILYPCVMYIGGQHLRLRWVDAQIPTRILLIVIVLLVVIGHARHFGVRQFGQIQKSLGGGKPETAFVKFSEHGKGLGLSLGLPPITNTTLLNGFWGPVSILFKTDAEIIFVNSAESELEEIATISIANNFTNYNYYRSDKTNIIIDLGLVPPVGTNVEGGYRVGEFAPVIAGYVNKPANPVKLTAKQIRADLIDVIIYAK